MLRYGGGHNKPRPCTYGDAVGSRGGQRDARRPVGAPVTTCVGGGRRRGHGQLALGAGPAARDRVISRRALLGGEGVEGGRVGVTTAQRERSQHLHLGACVRRRTTHNGLNSIVIIIIIITTFSFYRATLGLY